MHMQSRLFFLCTKLYLCGHLLLTEHQVKASVQTRAKTTRVDGDMGKAQLVSLGSSLSPTHP